MLVVNETNLSGRCIPSTLQLSSGQALLRTGQREYRPRNPVSTPLYKIVEDYWEMFLMRRRGVIVEVLDSPTFKLGMKDFFYGANHDRVL